jgi:hypothetical protein
LLWFFFSLACKSFRGFFSFTLQLLTFSAALLLLEALQFFWTSCALRMGTAGFPETAVTV